jgi:hypothetical protein
MDPLSVVLISYVYMSTWRWSNDRNMKRIKNNSMNYENSCVDGNPSTLTMEERVQKVGYELHIDKAERRKRLNQENWNAMKLYGGS